MTLPLRLAPFEEYMLADDRPAYPMRFLIRLRFTGCLDRQALDIALTQAVNRHPLLTARVESRGKRLYWVPGDVSDLSVDWLTQALDEHSPILEPIDLQVQPAIRVWAWNEGDSSQLLLQLHHASCDGLGTFGFLEDLLIFYDAAWHQDLARANAQLSLLNASHLRTRGRFGLTPRKLLKMVPAQLTGLFGVAEFMRHKVLPLGSSRLPSDWSRHHCTLPGFLEAQLPAEELARYREQAKQAGATTNDCLARDLFLAIGQWCERYQQPQSEGWWRLSIPMNLRGMSDCQLPAANVVSMVFLDRREADLADPAALLASIHDQMDLIKRRQLGLTFVLSLGLVRALPGGIARATRPDRCAATCVLSNLGLIFHRLGSHRERKLVSAGNVMLQSLQAVSPLRPHTSVAIAVIGYADQFFFTFSYDQHVLSRDQAQSLFDFFLNQIRRSC